MGHITLVEGKSKLVCDVCSKEISVSKSPFVILYQTFWKENTIYLCSKHGKQVAKYIKTLCVEGEK